MKVRGGYHSVRGVQWLLLGIATWSVNASGTDNPALPQGTCRFVGPVEFAFDCHIGAFGGYLFPEATTKPLRVIPAKALDDANDMTACSSLSDGALAEAVALVRRGDCAFQQKLKHVSAAGGRAMILINSDDSILQLGSLEYERSDAIAVAVKRTDGDRLLSLAASAAPDETVSVMLASTLTIYEQALHRIRHLVMINAPLVAHETYLDVVPSTHSDMDDMLALLDRRRHRQGDNDEAPPEDARQDMVHFFSACSDLLPSAWEFTKEAAFHAALTGAVLAMTTTMIDTDLRDQLLFTGAKRLIEAGYYSHAESCLQAIQDRSVQCEVAFTRFLRGDLAQAMGDVRECESVGVVINISTASLQVPFDNFERLSRLEMSEKDRECVRNTANGSKIGYMQQEETCCRRRIQSRDEYTANTRSRLTHSFRSTFVEELFHTLNVMGVFMDEIGAFDESLTFFGFASNLCGEVSSSLHLRQALAIPIVFQSHGEISSHADHLQYRITNLLSRRRREEHILSSMTGTTDAEDLLSRPEEASYLRYTITPSTMFVGYQGDDVLNLQRSIYSLRVALFPSLTSKLELSRSLSLAAFRNKRRIGFVSTWFRSHSVGKLLLGIIKQLDRSKFHVMVYRAVHFLKHSDEMTGDFRRQADSYMELPINQEDALVLLRSEELDILVYPELGMDAWTVFLSHHRIAPVQCVFWGHPITTGNPAIDYFISSEFFISDFFEGRSNLIGDDEDDAESWPGQYHGSSFSEQVVIFRGLSTFFTQPKVAKSKFPITRAMLHLPENRRLYVCPQTLMKLHPDFDFVLEGILVQDPMAYVILLSSPSQFVWKEKLRRRFRRHFGENDRRVLFFSTLPYREFIALLEQADVILDPFPFGGGVTTLDALAVGTPVVTLPSAQTVMQLAAGFLRYMGVEDSITNSVDEYVAAAIRIANDQAHRAALRERILSQRGVIYEDASTLDDWNAFLSNVEA